MISNEQQENIKRFKRQEIKIQEQKILMQELEIKCQDHQFTLEEVGRQMSRFKSSIT